MKTATARVRPVDRRGPHVRRALPVGGKPTRRLSVAFEQFIELLDVFVARERHAAVLYGERVGNFPLGHRATYDRGRYRRGWLSPEQIHLLEDSRRFPGWTWHPLERRFAEVLRHLQRFIAREGHARVPPSHTSEASGWARG